MHVLHIELITPNTEVRISLQSDHSFRSKLTTHFGRI